MAKEGELRQGVLGRLPQALTRFRTRGIHKAPEGRPMDMLREAERWGTLIDQRKYEAEFNGLPGRFTYAREPERNSYYFTLTSSNGISVLFVERNRDVGRGKRSAVLYTPGHLHLLETVNPVDPRGEVDPNVWRVVGDSKMKAEKLKKIYADFKDMPIYTGAYSWKGRYPNRDEVLEAFFESIH